MRFPLALVLVALCFGSLTSAQSVNQMSRYQQWLREDAGYIITEQEAAQFVLLKTNSERDEFITNFWLRRDPTPGSIENEYKEEHYRRIAYANEHFAENTPGWKTDRGGAYIVYGPPDRVIQRRLTTGEQAEDWIWSSSSQSARRMTFIDYCKCGLYQLQTNITDK